MIVASSGLLGCTSSKTETFVLASLHGTRRILLHVHSSKASYFFLSLFLTFQLSLPYVTVGNIIVSATEQTTPRSCHRVNGQQESDICTRYMVPATGLRVRCFLPKTTGVVEVQLYSFNLSWFIRLGWLQSLLYVCRILQHFLVTDFSLHICVSSNWENSAAWVCVW
jgi:hypothetical protein